LILRLTTLKGGKLPKRVTDIFLSFILATVFILAYHLDKKSILSSSNEDEEEIARGSSYMFGFNTDSFYIEKNIIKKNDVLGNILSDHGINTNLILLLEHEAKNIFNIRNIRTGQPYHVVKKHECDDTPLAIVYEPDNFKYVVCDLRDTVTVKLVEKDIEICEEVVSGKIESSLWGTLESQGVNPGIIDLMEEALSSSVDFYHTRKGDEFKLIYENKYVDGQLTGLGRLIAACYINENGANYSILYKSKEFEGYFDAEGRPARKSFLKAPVKFTRISSNYNLRRFHPIKGKTIPHLGTDYAAPYGTEIRSVSDGVVTASSYTSGNGNFVKVKHDNVYETQYLHMSRFAKGIRPGVRVRQGQTIGFVGSTGLATGPHVCFRFWKNGRQVNHLKEKLPPPQPMNKLELPDFMQYRDQLLVRLNELQPAGSGVAGIQRKEKQVVNP
jgi:murein DD-endopeptidase MepM/ murein hydrolase activator NlpD